MLFDLVNDDTEFKSINTLTYGYPKSGKTTLNHAYGKLFDKPPLMIMTEKGLGRLKAHVAYITSWSGYQTFVQNLQINKKKVLEEYSCFVVDLIGELDLFCTMYVCKFYKIESLADLNHGKGYFLQAQQFKFGLTQLFSFGLPVKFIAHAKEKTVKEGNKEVVYIEPDISKQARNYILGKCDAIGFIEPTRPDGSSVISFNSQYSSDTGSRFPQITKSYAMDHSDLSNTLKSIEKDFSHES